MFRKIILILSIATMMFAISCSSSEDPINQIDTNDRTIMPEVEDNTPEARAFLSLFQGKTEVVDETGAYRYTIRDGGKTLSYEIDTDENGVIDFILEKKFQSAKDSKTAYYTQEFSPRDFYDHSTILDKAHYRYYAFKIKNNEELMEYSEYTEDFHKRWIKFMVENFNTVVGNGYIKHEVRQEHDYSEVNFSHFFPGKDDIDLNKTYKLRKLK